MEVSGQLHVPAAVFSETELQYPLDRSTCQFHSRSGNCGEEKNLLPLSGNRTPIIEPSALMLVPIRTELSNFISLIREPMRYFFEAYKFWDKFYYLLFSYNKL
jgi:hypothetical protein